MSICSFNLLLKSESLSASTIGTDKPFHKLIILTKKECWKQFTLDSFEYNVYLWLHRVFQICLNSKTSSNEIPWSPNTVLYTLLVKNIPYAFAICFWKKVFTYQCRNNSHYEWEKNNKKWYRPLSASVLVRVCDTKQSAIWLHFHICMYS